jgi:putative oxidoreductase
MCVINKIKSYLGFLTPDIILVVMRLAIGLIFIQTGLGKLTHLGDTTMFFADLGIPFPGFNALIASSTEFIGGCLLILGLATRLISIPLSIIMIVAILTAQPEALHSISSFIRLQEFDYLLIFLLFFSAGPGKFSLDTIIRKYFIDEPE